MDRHLATLKLMLDGLGVPFNIDTLDERKVVQKAIYLAQRARVDLGYRFGWYVHGPYSPPLARDYFSLRDRLSVGDRVEDLALNDSARARLEPVRAMMTPPAGSGLSPAGWLELLASLDYQRTVVRRSPEDSREVIRTQKAPLYPSVGVAEEALKRAGLE